MPEISGNASDANVNHQKRAATLNKGGAICGFIAAIVAVAFPPLAPLAIVFAVASAGMWYQAGVESRSAAKASALQDASYREDQEREKEKRKKMQAHLRRLEQNQQMNTQHTAAYNPNLVQEAHMLADQAHLQGGSTENSTSFEHDHVSNIAVQNHSEHSHTH